MKGTERRAKKALSEAELRAELESAEKKRFETIFRNATAPLSNPMELRSLRRHVARLKTWIREKETAAAQGGKNA